MKRKAMLCLCRVPLLAGCGGGVQFAADEAAAAAEAAPLFTVGQLYDIGGSTYGLNAARDENYLYTIDETLTFEGEETYQYTYSDRLLVQLDPAKGTRRAACRVPGCSHNSETCPAWVAGTDRTVQPIWTENGIYLLYMAGPVQWSVEEMQENYREMRRAYENNEITEQDWKYFLANYRVVTRQDKPMLEHISPDFTQRSLVGYLDLDSVESPQFYWCDGTALYGYDSYGTTGLRLDLADGSLQTFALQQNEIPVSTCGDKLLTTCLQTDGSLPVDPDAADAVVQNGWYEYSLLDPAAGVRTRLARHDNSGLSGADYDSGFIAWYGGTLYCQQRTSDRYHTIVPAAVDFCVPGGDWQQSPLEGLLAGSYSLQSMTAWCPPPDGSHCPYAVATTESNIVWLDLRTMQAMVPPVRKNKYGYSITPGVIAEFGDTVVLWYSPSMEERNSYWLIDKQDLFTGIDTAAEVEWTA